MGYTKDQIKAIQDKSSYTLPPQEYYTKTGSNYVVYNSTDSSLWSVGYFFKENICYEVAWVAHESLRDDLLDYIKEYGFYYEGGFWYHDKYRERGEWDENDGICMFYIRHWH